MRDGWTCDVRGVGTCDEGCRWGVGRFTMKSTGIQVGGGLVMRGAGEGYKWGGGGWTNCHQS